MKETSEFRFQHTRRAIESIADRSLSRDFDDLLKGVEYSLENDDLQLGDECVGRLTVIAFTLCRTIGGDATVGIIEGLRQDIIDAGVALRPPVWTSGRQCVTNGQCNSAPNSSCYKDSTGCAGKLQSGSISASYVWGITLL